MLTLEITADQVDFLARDIQAQPDGGKHKLHIYKALTLLTKIQHAVTKNRSSDIQETHLHFPEHSSTVNKIASSPYSTRINRQCFPALSRHPRHDQHGRYQALHEEEAHP